MRLLLLLPILLASACAVVPDDIRVADETNLISYQEVIVKGEGAMQKPARWGGIIAGVENKDGSSVVEVVHFPLNSYGKPAVSAESVGRFKVAMKGFLDPVVFESGRIITFTGTVDKPVEGTVGEQAYLYPSLAADSYHLWRKQTVYDVSGTHFDMYAGWYSPYWSPFFHSPFRHGFSRTRVKYTERAPSSNPNNRPVVESRPTPRDDRMPPKRLEP